MNKLLIKSGGLVIALAIALLAAAPPAEAVIEGVTGLVFNFTAKAGSIVTGDGDSVHMWGYANGAGAMQYPGPTMIVDQGSSITVNLSNQLSVPVSIVFPGQNVTAAGGTPGLITREAPPGGVVSYTFTVSQPGTYTYYSGTQSELQIEMGLVGALIVRPGVAGRAYNDASTAFDREYLFLLTEIDPAIHQLVSNGQMGQVDNTTRFPVLWFLNGRNLPDTMSPAFAAWLPNQPYDSFPMMHPGEKVLMRIIGAGRDPHPFHTHGNNHLVIARDGRLLSSTGISPDLAESDFTHKSYPGETVDAIWTWTGRKLGWDIYGHTPGDPMEPGEYAPDHGKPVPVTLPDFQKDTANGMFFSGGPFLGTPGALPPGEGGFNPWAGLFFMWHSHAEKEMTNNNIFPGGMVTMALILPPNVPIP